MTNEAEPATPPDDIAPEVAAQIAVELGPRAEKVLACLRTAATLIAQARTSTSGLRLAESAAYNLREALDAVVESRPVPEGGAAGVLTAWKRYTLATSDPAADLDAARLELEGALAELERDEERQAFKTRKLLEYVRDQTGVEPLPGEHDPTTGYGRLRRRANEMLHEDGTVSGVAALYDDTVAWFVRFFIPPDERASAIISLAGSPYSATQLDELRGLVVNAHHLGLFLSRLQDSAWLDPLHDARLISLPRSGEPWPVASLVGSETLDVSTVAAVLSRLFAESLRASKGDQLGSAQEILRAASRLGVAGYEVANRIVARHPTDRWVQMIAFSIIHDADAADPVQFRLADALIGNELRAQRGYYTRRILTRLIEGLTSSNVHDRVGMLAAKTRRFAADDHVRFVLDIAALPTEGDDLTETALILSQTLTAAIPAIRALGLSTQDLLAMLGDVPGELGERIVCQVLAGAADVPRATKVGHIERRLASNTATGDDRDLIQDILTIALTDEEVALWRAAVGSPSPAVDAGFGQNWPKGWRWSMVLPGEVLDGWDEAIAAVSAEHGTPTPASLDSRIDRFRGVGGSSPYPGETLATMSPLEAAAVVAAWRPDPRDALGVSARELARSLEAVVKANPLLWSEEPVAIVSTLREPVYIDHYFRAITASAEEIPARAHDLLGAAVVVRAERWPPTTLGRDDFEFEPDWFGVETAIVEMIEAFANKDGELAEDIDLCWELATALVQQLPDDLPGVDRYEDASEHDDPLNTAINRPYGSALEAIIGLGGWEHRTHGAASPLLAEVLDEVLRVPGAVGLELRAVIVSRLPFVAAIASDWLDTHAAALFSADGLGAITFDQALKWSRPTKWFFDRYRDELIAAARRGATHAMAWLLIAHTSDEPGYTAANLVSGLRPSVSALRSAAEESASVLQGAEANDPIIERGLEFWEYLLNAERADVPAESLDGFGRWTFVTATPEERWFDLMSRTLELTDGEIDMTIEIAERCKVSQPSETGLRMLRLMVGRGEPWEQHHVETVAVEALRAAAPEGGREFELLRSRLIERGRHDAVDIVGGVPPS